MLRLEAGAIGLALLLACGDGAERPAIERAFGPTEAGQLSSYHPYVWTGTREIPDDDRRGVLIGPVSTSDDGADLGSVLLRLVIRHPAPGDLDIRLAYDGDGDGRPETLAPVEFFRARSGIRAKEVHACPRSLEGTYFFGDGPDGEEAVFSPFNTLRRGHAFYLAVADTLAGDTGTVLGWAVYLERTESETPR